MCGCVGCSRKQSWAPRNNSSGALVNLKLPGSRLTRAKIRGGGRSCSPPPLSTFILRCAVPRMNERARFWFNESWVWPLRCQVQTAPRLVGHAFCCLVHKFRLSVGPQQSMLTAQTLCNAVAFDRRQARVLKSFHTDCSYGYFFCCSSKAAAFDLPLIR